MHKNLIIGTVVLISILGGLIVAAKPGPAAKSPPLAEVQSNSDLAAEGMGFDFGAPCDSGLYVAKLEQAESSLELVHLAVDSGRDHGRFIGVAEIFQIIDPLLGSGFGANDGAAFEGVIDLRGMEA